MPKKVKVDGRIIVVPDDATADEIDQISQLGSVVTTNAARPPAAMPTNIPQISAQPSFPSIAWFKKKGYELADTATNALPAVGGVGGGLIGGSAGSVAPGAGTVAGGVGGAMLGGAAGESARQLSRRLIFPPSKGWTSGLPETSSEALASIENEGVKQGAYEVGGQLLRGAGRMVAPKLAEASAAPGKRLLKTIPEGTDTIGETILKDTKGVRPKTIVKEFDTKIAKHSTAEDDALAAARDKGATVSLAPSRKIVADESAEAVRKNAPAYIKDVKSVSDQLANQYGPTGAPLTKTIEGTKEGAGFVPSRVPIEPKQVPVPLPDVVDPVRARELRQGLDLSIGSWNPESQQAIAPLQKRVYGALTGEIHSAVPEVVEHDAAMTRMIPARAAVYNTSFNPGITKSITERFVRPTGALVGGAFGANEGYQHGGVGGAVAGGLTGLILPNAIASPTGLMTAARIVNSAIPSQAVRIGAPIIEGQITKPTASKKKRPDGTEDEE